jgi:hypothetical protein
MILSRILMVLALAVLAYLVWITMNSSETPKATTATTAAGAEHFALLDNFIPGIKKTVIFQKPAQKPAQETAEEPPMTPNDIVYSSDENIGYNQDNERANITYEHFADVGGIADSVHGAAPFGSNAPVNEGDMATVKYTGLADAKPGDVIQIEGTDLLTAPLVDNMLYTNSIANTNRNASQDLRGDIPLQFNDTYTPFYSSVIYGAPLSQKQMTIGNI